MCPGAQNPYAAHAAGWPESAADPRPRLKIRGRRADEDSEMDLTRHPLGLWQRLWIAAALLGLALTWSLPVLVR